jgi:hypothetical protein
MKTSILITGARAAGLAQPFHQHNQSTGSETVKFLKSYKFKLQHIPTISYFP